ncbi:MAG: phosphotransferase family protein [Pseudomonadota bacterium]
MGAADIRSDAPELVDPLEQHRIDHEALTDWLVPHVPAAAGGLAIKQFQGGMSNPTYLLTASKGHQYIMRKKPPGKLLPKAHQVDREYKVMDALAGSDVPVPQMIALCEDPDVIGVEFYVMEFVDGRIVKTPDLATVAREDRRPLMCSLIDSLAALHKVDHVAVGLERFGRPDGYIPRQTQRWAGQYEAAKSALPADFDYSTFDFLRDWVLNEAEHKDETSIVHGDFRPGNTITHPSVPKTTAVLDWELATIGHPLSDLSYFCLPFRQPHDMSGVVGIDLKAEGLMTEEEVLARYAEQTGRDGIPDWPVYLAFNYFRLAAIIQGVAARAAMGNVSSASADPLGDLQRAGRMAEIGAGIARRA